MAEYLREVQRKKRILLKNIPKKGGENGRHLHKNKTNYVPKKKQKAALEYMEREQGYHLTDAFEESVYL